MLTWSISSAMLRLFQSNGWVLAVLISLLKNERDDDIGDCVRIQVKLEVCTVRYRRLDLRTVFYAKLPKDVSVYLRRSDK